MVNVSRRGFLAGLLAAPIIVRATSIMSVRALPSEMLETYDPQFAFDVRQQALSDLADWFSTRLEVVMFKQLSGAA